MQRKLLFRVWTGSGMEYNVMTGKFGSFYVNPGLKGDGLDEKDSASLTTFTTIYNESNPVMQYTNLLDKDGIQVYEGDIVKVFDTERYCSECSAIENVEQSAHREECDNYWCTQVVKWRNGYFCDEDNGEYCPGLDSDEIELEVIGNIYQNPELLKKK